VASDLLHFLLALPVLLFLLAFNSIYPGPTLLLLPIIVTIQFLLTLSLVYFVATIQVRFRDTQYLLGIALLLFFYLTPIFYDATNVPARYAGIFRLNPMLHFVESYRAIFLHNRVPNLSPLLIVGLISVGLTWLGYKIYMRASWHFAEEL
jgi:lipopolysaccharide transport system permease protein